ncbi:MAG: hypothetical protein WC269_06245, partial [Candidatus Gracilibacteria bacterium]
MDELKKYWRIGLISFVGSFILFLVTGMSTFTWFSLIAYILILDYILVVLEKDTTIKKWLYTAIIIMIGVAIFLGFRITIGYFVGLPLIQEWRGTNNLFFRVPAEGGLQINFILEMLFILPGILFSYALIKGGAKTKGLIGLISLAMFFVVVLQIKQPELSNAYKRDSQANINLKTSQLNLSAYKKEVLATTNWGTAIVGIGTKYAPLYDDQQKFNKMEPTKLDKVIVKGTVFISSAPDLKTITFQGQPFVEIRLPNPITGGFIGGETMWVEGYLVKWEKTSPFATEEPKTTDGWEKVPGTEFEITGKGLDKTSYVGDGVTLEKGWRTVAETKNGIKFEH